METGKISSAKSGKIKSALTQYGVFPPEWIGHHQHLPVYHFIGPA
jgi:hypothetical protein